MNSWDDILSEEYHDRYYPHLERDLRLASGATKVKQGKAPDKKLIKLQCSQCAAPLPRNGWTCEYCGTSFKETPLDVRPYRVSAPEPIEDMPTTVSTCCLTMSY